MNREIKFRTWDDTNKELVYPKQGIFSNGITSGHMVDHCDVIEQFTGIQDKDGKEIYEGDLIQNISIGNYCSYKVIFENGCFIGRSDEGDEYGPYTLKLYINDKNPRLKVIGNIHDTINTNKQ